MRRIALTLLVALTVVIASPAMAGDFQAAKAPSALHSLVEMVLDLLGLDDDEATQEVADGEPGDESGPYIDPIG